ncbi:MAG: hypothetical protein DMG53_04820 [Acidobacteria bacterium]|nr:MAG: hypothetical protein DMG53_04820 [Acidobacteriota bacterium]PYU73562.1 MAG: hypothetical protein DMG52_14740 [Acidobacteriota bacterium]
MGSLADFLSSEAHQRNFSDLTETVRKGGTTVAQGDNTKPNDELWATFERTMAPLTTVSAGFIADLAGAKEGKACQVLDIAAGHWVFGNTIAKQNPNADEDRITPPVAAAFSLIMLAGTDSGDAYTFSQYEKMFRNAGFARTTEHAVPESPQQLLLSEK